MMAGRRLNCSLAISIGLCNPALATGSEFTAGIAIGVSKEQSQETQQGHRDATAYTWGAAAITVMRAGYLKPVRVSLNDGVYRFRALRLDRVYDVQVSRQGGFILRSEAVDQLPISIRQ